jgi:glycolate oxidase FAD binding subunit
VRGATHDQFWQDMIDGPLHPDRVVYRATLPRAAIFDSIERMQHWRAGIVSDAASGTVWLMFPADENSIARFSGVESMARQRGGHALLFAAPARLKAGINVWGASPPTLSLMRQIKRQFDPDELLNPGRFIGGL